MQKWLALAGVVVFWFGGAPGWASTNCTPGLPLGDGDDTGITTCNSETEYCETHTALVMSQAMCSILTCHKKQANHAVTGNSSNTPEETCEGAALTTFVAKATKAQGRRGAQCGCVDIADLTSLIEVSLDAMINSALYCAPGPPIDPGGDDLGTLGTPQEVKAESALGACLCKFSTALIGCHRKAAQDARSAVNLSTKKGAKRRRRRPVRIAYRISRMVLRRATYRPSRSCLRLRHYWMQPTA